MHRRLSIIAFIAVGGCAMDEGFDVETVEEEAVSANGVSLNGVSLNGVSLNGVSLNGVSLNGVSLNGVSLNGVTLSATNFSGTNASGQPISGAGFVGTTWTGTLSNGSTLKLRIDSRVQGTGANSDVWMYGVSYQTSTAWARLCGSDTAGAPILAVPVSGTWSYQSGVPGGGGFTADSTRFTFGCRGTAIAKCVELGYKPWKTVAGKNLTNHHVACTRLLRADYCGDGTSYTVDGTMVNLYDALGIQGDTEAWLREAEWTAAGARCVAPGTPQRVLSKLLQIPPCFAAKLSLTCGAAANFNSTGTLIMSETKL